MREIREVIEIRFDEKSVCLFCSETENMGHNFEVE